MYLPTAWTSVSSFDTYDRGHYLSTRHCFRWITVFSQYYKIQILGMFQMVWLSLIVSVLLPLCFHLHTCSLFHILKQLRERAHLKSRTLQRPVTAQYTPQDKILNTLASSLKESSSFQSLTAVSTPFTFHVLTCTLKNCVSFGTSFTSWIWALLPLNISGDGAPTASMGSLCLCLTAL